MVIPRSLPGHLWRPRGITLLLVLAMVCALLVALPARPAAAATCPCSIFSATQTPANPSENDTDAVELGMKFRADTDGAISAIRFYKGTGNGGIHTGSLWDSAGARLSTVTFAGETATGWQQANLPSPVAVTAGTTYVASYYAPMGRYAADTGYFANAAVVNSPLTALQNGTDGGNGVYRYGAGRRIPQQHLPEQQLLGGRGLHHQRHRHHQADANGSPAPRRRDQFPGGHRCVGDLQRTGPADDHRVDRERSGWCCHRDLELRPRHSASKTSRPPPAWPPRPPTP